MGVVGSRGKKQEREAATAHPLPSSHSKGKNCTRAGLQQITANPRVRQPTTQDNSPRDARQTSRVAASGLIPPFRRQCFTGKRESSRCRASLGYKQVSLSPSVSASRSSLSVILPLASLTRFSNKTCHASSPDWIGTGSSRPSGSGERTRESQRVQQRRS